MDRKEKARLLIDMAKAYMARGQWLQYDQLSLDRIVRCTARRNAFAPPEAAAEGRYLFLDCAAFVWACYYQTFDYRLEADMVINMIDHLSARVFYYELTHEESGQRIEEILEAFRSCLQPGDIISYERTFHAAHTVLYMGDGQFIHCTQEHGFNGYDYEKKQNVFDPEGGVRIDSLDCLIRDKNGKRYLFSDTVKRFSVNRPLDVAGDPAEKAVIRSERAKDLCCSVYPSVTTGHTASPAGPVSYEVEVKNLGKELRHVEVRFEPGIGTQLYDGAAETVDIPPGKTVRTRFTVMLDIQKGLPGKPLITVNSLPIYVPDVAVWPERSCGNHVFHDIPGPEACAQALRRLFFLHDTVAGDVLSRRPWCPSEDMGVYCLYGGFGVITPRIAAGEEVRTVFVDRNCLEPGDIILCADDALLEKSYAVRWDGESLSGSFEFAEPRPVKSGKDADRWIDTLFGRFCFAVIRPSLSKRNSERSII